MVAPDTRIDRVVQRVITPLGGVLQVAPAVDGKTVIIIR